MELKNRIKKMIVEQLFLPVDPQSIADDADLMETFGVDSVALFTLAIGVEDEFGVSMEDTDLSVELFGSVNAIAAFLTEKGVS